MIIVSPKDKFGVRRVGDEAVGASSDGCTATAEILRFSIRCCPVRDDIKAGKWRVQKGISHQGMKADSVGINNFDSRS